MVVHAITRDRTDIGQSSNRLTNDVSANKTPGNVPGFPLIGAELSSVRLWQSGHALVQSTCPLLGGKADITTERS